MKPSLHFFTQFFSFLPVAVVIFAFWYFHSRKAKKLSKIKEKNDVWYIVKEYLKKKGKFGHKIENLTLYPRPQTINALREYIKAGKNTLKDEKFRLLGIKPSFKWAQLRSILPLFSEKKKFPQYEKYHRELEIATLNIASSKYSIFQDYLDKYLKSLNSQKFNNLLTSKLVDESMRETYKKGIIHRNRYLVCFRTINKSNILSNWEAIEIELFKSLNTKKKEKYRILFTKEVEFYRELHWIYSMHTKYLKSKYESEEKIRRELKKSENRKNRNLYKLKTRIWSITSRWKRGIKQKS